MLDVRGSVHHSIIHKENPTRCNKVSKFYFIIIWSSTCFGLHTAHHWTCSCWTLSASSNYTSNNPPRTQNRRLL